MGNPCGISIIDSPVLGSGDKPPAAFALAASGLATHDTLPHTTRRRARNHTAASPTLAAGLHTRPHHHTSLTTRDARRFTTGPFGRPQLTQLPSTSFPRILFLRGNGPCTETESLGRSGGRHSAGLPTELSSNVLASTPDLWVLPSFVTPLLPVFRSVCESSTSRDP